jgi:hypothetical protein
VLPYWDTVIRPLVAAMKRGPIIEIGAAKGETTVRLAELASELDVTLHSVDPLPELDVTELENRFGDRFRFHRERSHDALHRIEPAAIVLIDGDHNWYTVHGELTRLSSIAAAAHRPFPLVMLHDVEWPYGRRDMYYDPESIPQEWRQPWDRRGIRWGERRLDESGRGVNSHLANAVEEGGPRNGVLTAIEDFVEGCADPPELRVVRGGAGIGVLASRDLLDASPELQRQWDRLGSMDFLVDHMAVLAKEAARAMATAIEAGQRAKRLKRRLEATQ